MCSTHNWVPSVFVFIGHSMFLWLLIFFNVSAQLILTKKKLVFYSDCNGTLTRVYDIVARVCGNYEIRLSRVEINQNYKTKQGRKKNRVAKSKT